LGSIINLTKNWLGYILGDFFTNSSGHPARDKKRGSVGSKQFYLAASFTYIHLLCINKIIYPNFSSPKIIIFVKGLREKGFFHKLEKSLEKFQ
jgi:hypothetical protein